MPSNFWIVVVTGLVAVVPADANRVIRAHDPDAAALIQGEWVVAVVERNGIVTPQFDSLAERRLNQLAESIFRSNGGDIVADHRPLQPAIPRDTLVYQFGGGRFAVYQDLDRVGWGRYRFHAAAPAAVLTLTWEKTPEWSRREEQYRGLIRFRNGNLDWCVDRARPDTVPSHFAADKGQLTIVTFWRISSRPAVN